jgi:hypothetical protein
MNHDFAHAGARLDAWNRHVVTSYAERNEGRDQAVAKTLAKRGVEAIVLCAPMRCYSFLAGIRKRFPDARLQGTPYQE